MRKDRCRGGAGARTAERGRRARLLLLPALVLLGWLQPLPAAGQAPSSFVPDTGAVIATAPHWAGEFAVFSGNALLSGVTAGLVQKLRGGSFRDGFTRGVVGGGVVYAGKRFAAERFDGAGLLGREVASVGTSMVRNASEGAGLLERLTLPVGIARVYLDRGGPRPVRLRLDAWATAWTLYGISQTQLDFDARASLSAGTPVFRTRNKVLSAGDIKAGGYAKAGVVLLSDVPAWGPVYATRALHHELEHVLQEDQILGMWLRPLQSALLPRLPGGRALDDWLDLNPSTEVLDGLSNLVRDHDVRPWELEADYLAKRR